MVSDSNQSRRTVLQSTTGLLSLGAVSTVAARDDARSPDGEAGAVGVSAEAVDASTPAFEPLGSVDVTEAKETVVTPDGSTAFVAVGTGFAAVDLSEPANPAVVSRIDGLETPDGNSVEQVLDVKYDDGRVAVPTAGQGGGPKGFFVYDVSDPANPTQVGEFFQTPDHGNHNSFFEDGVVYLTAGWEVDIVDVSGDSFERLATWEPGDWDADWESAGNMVLHDLYVQGEYAYLAYWDAGTFLLDVSDPATPDFVSRFGDYSLEETKDLTRQAYYEPEGNAHTIAVNDDASLLAVGAEAWDLDLTDDTGGPGGITLYDISTKTSPERLGEIAAPESGDNRYSEGTWTTSHNVELAGDRLYASWYRGGVSIHDVSDPTDPGRIAWWADPDVRDFWAAVHAVDGEYFVGGSTSHNGLEGGVLTFPDQAGEMASPPSGIEWPTARDDGNDETTTTEPTTQPPTAEPTTQPPTAEPTTQPPTAEPTTPSSTDADSATTPTDGSGDGTTQGGDATDGTAESDGTSGSIPGFGALTALGGLGLGAARYLRSDSTDE